jgi:hypothetical protein
MKKSFFSRFKDKLNKDYGGRFVSLLLKEIMNEEPKVASVVFPSLKKYTVIGTSFDIQEEYRFPGRMHKTERRADLAILNHKTPIALLEVKYEDEKQSTNAAQLDDYLEFCSKENIPFTYLTQYLPLQSDADKIEAKNIKMGKTDLFKHFLYSQLYKKLEKIDHNHAVIMFREFLKTEGNVFDKNIDEDVLQLFLSRCIFPSHQSGLGVLNSDERIHKTPEVLSILINNTASLAEVFFEKIGKKHNCKRKPSVGFVVNQKQDGSEGNVSTEAYNVLSYRYKNKNYPFRIVFGFRFNLIKNKGVSKYIYANVYKGSYFYFDSSPKCRHNNTDTDVVCFKKIIRTLDKAIDNFLEEQKDINSSFKRELRDIKEQIDCLL